MTLALMILHGIICFALIALVMVQRGRGGGLVESFSGIESMFGTKTSTFLTKATTVLSIMFFITCLSLAFLSIRQSKSLMTAKPAIIDTKEQAAAGPQTPQGAPQNNAQEPAKPQ